jgi:hypothetical protein
MNPPTITTEQANTFINVTLPTLCAIALAVGSALITLWAKLSTLAANQKNIEKTQDTHSERLNSQGDRIHTLAMNATPPSSGGNTTNIEVQPTSPTSIVSSLLGFIAIGAMLLSGCASDGSLTPQGQKGVNLGVAILNAAIDGYVQADAAKTSGKKLTKGQIAQLAKNDVNGVLAQMQANVGNTPDAANVAIGAANPVAGAAIQDALPAKPITQSTINQIASAVK